jgi:hypothetical protein
MPLVNQAKAGNLSDNDSVEGLRIQAKEIGHGTGCFDFYHQAGRGRRAGGDHRSGGCTGGCE